MKFNRMIPPSWHTGKVSRLGFQISFTGDEKPCSQR